MLVRSPWLEWSSSSSSSSSSWSSHWLSDSPSVSSSFPLEDGVDSDVRDGDEVGRTVGDELGEGDGADVCRTIGEALGLSVI